MSALDVIYRDTVTLFNRHGDEDSVIWYPTILTGVHLVTDRAALIGQYGETVSDNAMMNVIYSKTAGVPYIAGKMYLTPKAYKNSEVVTNMITFQYGDTFDFIYGGQWNDTNPVSDSSYTKGFYNYMNKNYDLVFAISSVSQYNLIPHFTVTAK